MVVDIYEDNQNADHSFEAYFCLFAKVSATSKGKISEA